MALENYGKHLFKSAGCLFNWNKIKIPILLKARN
jgi:hypothetical protein